MPALPPKADIATIKQMSAKGHKWTFGHSFDHLVGAQRTIPGFGWAGSSRLATPQASAAPSSVAGGDLIFVGGEGCQDFVLLALRDLEEVQGPSEFRCDLIEFCGGDLEAPMGLLKSERRRAGLGGRILEGSTRNVANPKRSHELEAGQPSQILGVPFRQPRVLGLLPDDGVLHDGIAEVIDHRRDGEDTSQPLVQAFFWRR